MRTNPELQEEEVVKGLLSEMTLAELKPLLVRLTMFTTFSESQELTDEALIREHAALKQQVEQALVHAGFTFQWDQTAHRYQIILQQNRQKLCQASDRTQFLPIPSHRGQQSVIRRNHNFCCKALFPKTQITPAYLR